MSNRRLMKRLLGRTVDARLWAAAMGLAHNGVSVPAIDLQFVQRELQDIEADLARWYLENTEVRDATLDALAAEGVNLQARTEGRQLDDEIAESLRLAERANPQTSEGRLLTEEGERARAARRDSQHSRRVADSLLAQRRQAQRNTETNVVDRLHLAALERRRALDEFIDILNALLRYFGYDLVEGLAPDVTDELVRRAVRPVDLEERRDGEAD